MPPNECSNGGVDDDVIHLTEPTRRWLRAVADRDHNGDQAAAAAAILEAACAAEQAPDDPWAYLTARQQRRAGR
jgi:hypothetical protein